MLGVGSLPVFGPVGSVIRFAATRSCWKITGVPFGVPGVLAGCCGAGAVAGITIVSGVTTGSGVTIGSGITIVSGVCTGVGVGGGVWSGGCVGVVVGLQVLARQGYWPT